MHDCVPTALSPAARCSGDLSSPIPVGCPVEMTAEQKVLQFVCSYTDLLEVCTWSVDGVSVGSTTQYYKQHIFDSGLVAVVSNNVPGQSDLTLYNVASPLAGMEVMCSCQVQGEEQGPPRTAKTAIGETGGVARVSHLTMCAIQLCVINVLV